VNDYRAKVGKSRLLRHSGLDKLAQQHCDYMVKNAKNGKISLNHDGSSTRSFLARRNLSIPLIAENAVSTSNRSAAHILSLWTASRAHDKNLRGKWQYVGIGSGTSQSGTVVSIAIFGTGEMQSKILP